jgi:serine/threonine protein phosphatase PrpC
VVTREGWVAVAASATGSAHGAGGHNQDALRIRELDGEWLGRGYVAAVADGHGGAAHARSATGAQFAVELATAHIVADVSAGRDPQGFTSSWMRVGVGRVLDAWQAAVAEHYLAHPFTAAETASGADESAPTVAYGATLLVVLVVDDAVLLAQLGDGDVLVALDGEPRRPMPGDGRLVAGETTSLCLRGAHDDVRYARLPANSGCGLVVLATDGYGNSFAERDWWSLVTRDYLRLLRQSGPGRLQQLLPAWLAESALVGGDDATVVVLARISAEVPSGALTLEPERTLT